MTNLARAEAAAVAEIERYFVAAGWSDGWGLTDDEIRSAASPLFYRGATPGAAADAKVVEGSVGHTLYAVYTVLKPDLKYAGNAVHHIELTVAITIYYDDASLFDDNSGFNKYLDTLLDKLSEGLWPISGEADTAVSDGSDRAPYIHRKVIYATNTF